MRRIAALSVFLVLLVPLAASAQSIEGVWTIVESLIGGGPGKRHTTDLAPGLTIITKSHYSMTNVGGGPNAEEARRWSDNPTDEERLAVFSAFIARAGKKSVLG